MKRDLVEETLKAILVNHLKLEANVIKSNSRLIDDLGLDSVDVMDTLCLIEESFKIKILETNKLNLLNLETVNDVCELIFEETQKTAKRV